MFSSFPSFLRTTTAYSAQPIIPEEPVSKNSNNGCCIEKICTFILTFIFSPFATLKRLFSKESTLELNLKPLKKENSLFEQLSSSLTTFYQDIKHHLQARPQTVAQTIAIVSGAIALTAIFANFSYSLFPLSSPPPLPPSSVDSSTILLGIGIPLIFIGGVYCVKRQQAINPSLLLSTAISAATWSSRGIVGLYEKYPISKADQDRLSDFITNELPDLPYFISQLYPILKKLPLPQNPKEKSDLTDYEGVIHAFLQNIQTKPGCDLREQFYHAACTHFDKDIPREDFFSFFVNQLFCTHTAQLLQGMNETLQQDKDIKKEDHDAFKKKVEKVMLENADEILVIIKDRFPDTTLVKLPFYFKEMSLATQYVILHSKLSEIYGFCKTKYLVSKS